jgi:hypothetical protein
METLGLSSPSQPSDNIFKRLFWPSVQNQYDVDLLGYQGFWVCLIIGLLSCVLQVIAGHYLAGPFTAILYILGGFGVRERSPAAAVLIFLLYVLDAFGSILILGGAALGNPFVKIVVVMLLLANIRATILSEKWRGDELPERSITTLTDKVANQLPPILWPKLRWVFFVLAPLTLMLSMAGLGMIYVQQQETLHMKFDKDKMILIDPTSKR